MSEVDAPSHAEMLAEKMKAMRKASPARTTKKKTVVKSSTTSSRRIANPGKVEMKHGYNDLAEKLNDERLDTDHLKTILMAMQQKLHAKDAVNDELNKTR